MIQVRRIDHVALRIDDVAASEAFYSGLLGLPRIAPQTGALSAADMTAFRADLQAQTGTPLPGGGLWVQVGDSQIHMIKAEKAEGRVNPFGAHLAMEVDDFEAAKRELDARNLAYVEAPPGMPVLQLWLLDPSGNTVELFAKPSTQEPEAGEGV